jgi:hypothetical protein
MIEIHVSATRSYNRQEIGLSQRRSVSLRASVDEGNYEKSLQELQRKAEESLDANTAPEWHEIRVLLADLRQELNKERGYRHEWTHRTDGSIRLLDRAVTRLMSVAGITLDDTEAK